MKIFLVFLVTAMGVADAIAQEESERIDLQQIFELA